MKSNRFLLLPAALIVLATACSREDGKPVLSGPVFRAGIETPTRVSFTDEGVFSWQGGDVVAVSTHDGFTTLTAGRDAEGADHAVFEGDMEGITATSVAFSPASIAKDPHTVTLPSEYIWAEGQSNAPMYCDAVSLSEVNTFRHLGGVIKIVYQVVPDGADALVLTADAAVTGDFPIRDGKITAGEGTGRVTVRFAAGSRPSSFYIPVPTGKYNISVALQKDGKVLAGTEKTSSAPLTIVRRTLLLMGEVDVHLPEQRAVVVDDSQLLIRWSNTGFEDIASDATHSYTAGIYRDAACTDILWAWTLPTGMYYWKSSSSYTRFQPGIVFSGLTPGETYFVRVTDNTTGTFSVEKYVMAPFSALDVTALPAGSAVEGDTVLSENFNQFWYGGRSPEGLPGYSSSSRSKAIALSLPSGENPIAASSNDLFPVASNVSMELYSTLANYVPATRMKDWRVWLQGNTIGAVSVQSGCLLVGGANYTGDIVTPPLNCLREKATLRVTFDAAPFIEHWAASTHHDVPSCVVHAFDGNSSVNGYCLDFTSTRPLFEEQVEMSSEPAFATYSVLVPNFPKGGRIGVGCPLDNTAGVDQHRCYIDNIRIEVVSYGETVFVPETVINGTELSAVNTAVGLVKDARTGAGISDVVVSDGYSCVKTDANGVYQFPLHTKARKVFISIPSAYEVPLNPKNHLPAFYSVRPLDPARQNRNDFDLTPLPEPESKFTLLMVGDPQCKNVSQLTRYVTETIPDICKTAEAQASSPYPHVYAMTLGDIVSDSPELWASMKVSMSNVRAGGWYIPFFQTIGNHDHNANRKGSDYEATTDFIANFGPTDYSFNRGDVHIISMDDVYGISSTGSTWKYDAGFTDEQFQWLVQDVANVPDKEKKMVFMCCHIPFRGGAISGGGSVNRDKHYADVLNLLTQFKEVHIMIGHTHYPQNYIHTSRKAKGGQPIYEHIHQAACGAWWTANSSVTGGPNGYNIYEINGSSIANWVNKGTDRDADYQLRVYDGNQTFSGRKGYVYSWSSPSNLGGSSGINAAGSILFKDSFVAEVWDDDDQHVRVEFWQNGRKVGNFTRLPNGSCTNVALAAFWFNEKAKNTETWANNSASHYWYYKPASGAPSTETDWEVRVTRIIPMSGHSNQYSRKSLTRDFSEF